MLIRVACGKGQKERLVPLSPRLLTELREYWKQVRSPKYLFPGATFDVRISSTTIQKSCKTAVVCQFRSESDAEFRAQLSRTGIW